MGTGLKWTFISRWVCVLDEITIIFWSCSFSARSAGENHDSETVAPPSGHPWNSKNNLNQNRKMSFIYLKKSFCFEKRQQSALCVPCNITDRQSWWFHQKFQAMKGKLQQCGDWMFQFSSSFTFFFPEREAFPSGLTELCRVSVHSSLLHPQLNTMAKTSGFR